MHWAGRWHGFGPWQGIRRRDGFRAGRPYALGARRDSGGAAVFRLTARIVRARVARGPSLCTF